LLHGGKRIKNKKDADNGKRQNDGDTNLHGA
jgi:hypothetical protein